MGQVETVKAPGVPGWEQYYKESESYWAGDINSGPKTAEGFYGWTGRGSSGTENYYLFGSLVRNTEYQGTKTNIGTDDVIRITNRFKGDGTSAPYRFIKISSNEVKDISIVGNIGGMHNPLDPFNYSYVNVRTYQSETTISSTFHTSVEVLPYNATMTIDGEEVPWIDVPAELKAGTYLEELSSDGVYVQGIYPFDVWKTGAVYVVSFAILLEDFSL